METVRSTNGEGKHARLAGHNHDDDSDDDVYSMTNTHTELQGNQLYMAMCFWYLVKSYLSTVQYTGKVIILQGAGKTQPCLSARVV